MCMRLNRWIVFPAVVGACAWVAGCQSGGIGADPTFLRGDSYSNNAHAPALPSEAPEREVTIDNFTFAPANLDIPAGTKVVWVNHDDVPHTIVSDAKLFSSKALDTDDQFSRVFSQAGTYRYFCGVHPHMTGSIVVK